ncbi:hypothetical protein WMY93_008300 [Mugilogobius chulae]|uniref:Uncharacterized protein n=1 Tax=Mugilogobius chulae TaxID=88201 RepID=A0AAW0PJ41_9GOBI
MSISTWSSLPRKEQQDQRVQSEASVGSLQYFTARCSLSGHCYDLVYLTTSNITSSLRSPARTSSYITTGHIARVNQSITAAALQSRQDVLQGVRLMVQHRCESSQDPPVPTSCTESRGQPRTELDFVMK